LASRHHIVPRWLVASRARSDGSARLASAAGDRRCLGQVFDGIVEPAARTAKSAGTSGEAQTSLFRRSKRTPRARLISECLCKRVSVWSEEQTKPVHKCPSRSYLAWRGGANTRTPSQEKAEGDMPLRQDGSGGTRSARPPTSIPPERTSRHAQLEGTATRGIDESLQYRSHREPRSSARRATPDANIPDTNIEVIEGVTQVNPFVASSRP
jgi:hypothetical protein